MYVYLNYQNYNYQDHSITLFIETHRSL